MARHADCEQCAIFDRALEHTEAELCALDGQQDYFDQVACLLIQRNRLRRQLAQHQKLHVETKVPEMEIGAPPGCEAPIATH